MFLIFFPNRHEENLNTSNDAVIMLDRVSFKSPFSEEVLVRELSLMICANTHLLVVGNTGTGKTSLIRVLNRVWNVCNGKRKRLLTSGQCDAIWSFCRYLYRFWYTILVNVNITIIILCFNLWTECAVIPDQNVLTIQPFLFPRHRPTVFKC